MKLGERGAIWERDMDKKGIYTDKPKSFYPFGRKPFHQSESYKENFDRIFGVKGESNDRGNEEGMEASQRVDNEG